MTSGKKPSADPTEDPTKSTLDIRLRKDVLRRELAKRAISTEEFASQIGCSYHALWRWMDGSRTPKPAARRKMCKALEMPFDKLFSLRRLDGGEPS